LKNRREYSGGTPTRIYQKAKGRDGEKKERDCPPMGGKRQRGEGRDSLKLFCGDKGYFTGVTRQWHHKEKQGSEIREEEKSAMGRGEARGKNANHKKRKN